MNNIMTGFDAPEAYTGECYDGGNGNGDNGDNGDTSDDVGDAGAGGGENPCPVDLPDMPTDDAPVQGDE